MIVLLVECCELERPLGLQEGDGQHADGILRLHRHV